jgi:5-methylcytosine-specific restriction endonuclease McrA
MADLICRKDVRDTIFKKYGGRCAYCGCVIDREKFTIDHIDPIFRGSTNDEVSKYQRNMGDNSIRNFNPCCSSCNSSKSTLRLEDWRKQIESKLMRINRDCSNYRILKRFGLIIETHNPVVFYFERYSHE